MKKILFICNYKPGVGGISGQVEVLQSHLREEGFTADVFSTRGNLFQRLLIFIHLHQLAKEYDVLHIHCCSGWGFLPAIIGVSAGRFVRKRIVLTYHGGDADRFFYGHTRLVRHFLSRTDTNIVLSGFLERIFNQYDLSCTIIPNIVELDSSLYKERTNLDPKFICIRSHEPLYDIPCILKAFQRFQKQIPEATLTLVGDGSQHDFLISLAAKMGLDNVVFTGRVDNSRIYEYLDKADIMLSSPTVDNMPVSLLEGMNAGLFVISTNVGGVPYMIDDGITGRLFPKGDDKALADLMMSVISNQATSKQMISEAKARIEQYTWKGVRKRILSLYE